MQKEIIVNTSPNEVRVALLEDREVVEFFMERAESRRAVGNVYKGVVTAVRPGLQAAFVEIGMEKAGFLHVSDLIHDDPDDDDDGRGRRRRRGRREGLRPIETMLKEGDELLVQVTKEIIGTKGPRLTADVSLPGRFMVLMPKGDHVGVSRKIEDRKERHRLRDLLSGMKPDDEGGAFIIRTAAIGIEPKMLQRDMEYLRNLWKEIQANAHSTKAPAVVHEDVGLLIGMIRDIFKDDIDGLVIDGREEYNELVQHVRNFSPELKERIHFYDGDIPLFDKFGVEQELKKSLERKVWMKRGGFLVIDETEALIAIDVNTGRYTGRKNQAETIFKTNMLAAREIARQVRLRDIGGIIVCDFIDMDSEEDKRKILNELRMHLKRDRARTKTFPVTDLGLVEMSRQRVQQSLKDRLSDDCPYCGGGGQVLSTDTLANKVERLLLKLAAMRDEKAVQVRANPTLALVLMTDRANGLQNIARSTGIRIDVVDDPRLHREQFQIVSLHRRKDLVAEIEKTASERREPMAQTSRPERGERRPDRADDSGERERGGRRRRRRGSDEEGSPAGERRPSRRSASADEGRSERPARGERPERGDRRPERADRPERTERADRADGADRGERTDRPERPERRRRPRSGERTEEAPVEVKESTAAAAPESGHPAETDEDSPRRRRRRRGRRGGRGRRRRGEEGGEEAAAGENGNVASSSGEARQARSERIEEERVEAPAARAQASESSSGAAGSDEGRPPRRRERTPRSGERERPAFTSESPADEPVAETAPVADPARENPVDGEGRRPRRRRRRRPGASSGPRSESSAPAAAPDPAAEQRTEPREPVAETRERRPEPVEERRESRPAPDSGSRAEREPSPRRAERPGPGSPGQEERSEYLRPVPEEEWMARKRAEEAAAPPKPDPVAPAPRPENGADGERPRRRRSRQAGTPTRLIGTGRKSTDDK